MSSCHMHQEIQDVAQFVVVSSYNGRHLIRYQMALILRFINSLAHTEVLTSAYGSMAEFITLKHL